MLWKRVNSKAYTPYPISFWIVSNQISISYLFNIFKGSWLFSDVRVNIKVTDASYSAGQVLLQDGL